MRLGTALIDAVREGLPGSSIPGAAIPVRGRGAARSGVERGRFGLGRPSPVSFARLVRLPVFRMVSTADGLVNETEKMYRSSEDFPSGGVAEWLKAPVLKTGRANYPRGFESHPLRFIFQ